VSTGKLPHEHGVISNILGYKNGSEVWAQKAALIKVPTIFQAASAKGLKVGSVAWPVTCGADIKWNLPEVHPLPGQNRLLQHLRHGSPIFQIMSLLRHIKRFKGVSFPSLDDFLTSVAVDLLRRKKPDLTLLHLLAYDLICHREGLKSDKLDIARAALDHNMGRVLKAAGDSTIIVFSDHGHLDIHENADLAAIFGDTLHEQCGGCAFFTKDIPGIKNYPWFGRFLTEIEMKQSGYANRAAFGIGAKPGYSLSKGTYKGNHGYPADYDDYRVFFAAKNGKKGIDNLPFNDIRNVGVVIDRELGLGMDFL